MPESNGLKTICEPREQQVMVPPDVPKKLVIDGTQYIDCTNCSLSASENEMFICTCGAKKTTLKAWRNHLGKKNRQKRRKQRLEVLQEFLESKDIEIPQPKCQKSE